MNAILEDIKQMVNAPLRHSKGCALMISLILGSMHVNAQESIKMTNQPVEKVVNDLGGTPKFADDSQAYPQHYRMSERMKELKSLEENWNNAGGRKISEKTILLAGNFVEVLSEEVLANCSLFAAVNSDVYIQGRFKKGSLIVTVSDESITYVLKGDGIERGLHQRCLFTKRQLENRMALSKISEFNETQ